MRYGLRVLFCLFCFAYPIAVIGVAFDVHPPFSLAWAGSILLFLEGVLLAVAAVEWYGWRRGLLATLIILLLSYAVEALGVGTGFPFGVYRYTGVLFPKLPGSVPLAVMFAWILIILGVFGTVRSVRIKGMWGVFLGALLATLLDLEIEPVAAHLEHYWEWGAPGPLSYYGVPLNNFLAWFVVSLVLLILVQRILSDRSVDTVLDAFRSDTSLSFETRLPVVLRRVARLLMKRRLAFQIPGILYSASLFMFGLVDLTHGYYGAAFGFLAGVLLIILPILPNYTNFSIAPTNGVQQNQALQRDRERV